MSTPTTRPWPGLFADYGGAGYTLRHPDFGGASLAIDGTDDWATVLEAASASIVAAAGGLIIGPGIYAVNDDVTLSCPIVFMPGAVLRPASEVTVTISGHLVTVPDRFFDVSAGGRFLFAQGVIEKLTPEMFAADTWIEQAQAAADSIMYGGAGVPMILPAGEFTAARTIHLGYGDQILSIEVEGSGLKYQESTTLAGTRIIAGFANAPLIAVSGQRYPALRRLNLLGQNSDHIGDNVLGGTVPLLDDTDPANWVDPVLLAANVNMASRYAPYAGVAVDPYQGSAPTPDYPDVVFPGWSGLSSQYGKSAVTTKLNLYRTEIRGFVVGVVTKPSGADGNADFTTLDDCRITNCVWGVSIAHGQSRNVALRNLNFANVYCALTNNQHGLQTGKFNGSIIDMALGQCIKIFEFSSTAVTGPIHFVNLFSEALWRIGDITGGGSSQTSLLFTASSFGFSRQGLGSGDTPTRGIPANVFEDSMDTGLPKYVFDGCYFNGYHTAMVFAVLPENIHFRGGCSLVPEDVSTISSSGDDYERLALQATSGGVVVARLGQHPQRGMSHDLRWRGINLATDAVLSDCIVDGTYSSSRDRPIPFLAKRAAPNSNAQHALDVPERVRSFTKGSLSSCSLSGSTLTLVFASLSDAVALYTGPMPGDVLWDSQSHMAFWVRSRSGTTVLAEAQTGLRDPGTGVEAIDFDDATGTFYCGVSRFFTPSYPLFGDITAASDTITNVQRADGNSDLLDSVTGEIVVGDALYVDPYREAYFATNGATIIAVDEGAKTIQVASNALVTATGIRLGFFIRQPPANV